MKNGYPFEKFSNAVHGMAVSPASIQRRVADAYIYNLIHLRAEELPEEIRHKFRELHETLTSVEPEGDEGSVYATTNQMGTDKAIEIAQSILYMAHIVESDYRND
jgi:hypothetical protein